MDWSLTLLKNSFSEDGSHDGLNQLKTLHTSLLNRPVVVIRVLIEVLESQEIAECVVLLLAETKILQVL